MQDVLNSEKLKSLNRCRKIERLNKSLELHQRFMMVIKDNSIPKLHEIVKVAISSKRSLQYIISKLIAAVDGVYNPKNSEDDKDLAFIILQYGGPGLLDVVHRALNFPSTSTAYRMIKNCRSLKSSINTPLTDFIENIFILAEFGYMLKIDETYNDEKVRWNPSDNRMYGICYELSSVVGLKGRRPFWLLNPPSREGS